MPVVIAEKVVAYVVHQGRLLVFTHGNEADPLTQSGLQVPSGTVEPGEPLEDAVLREVAEETGLRTVRVAAQLGTADYDFRPQREVIARRHFFALTCDPTPPERWVHQPGPETEEHGAMVFVFQWLPVERAHVLAGGLGAMLGRLAQVAP